MENKCNEPNEQIKYMNTNAQKNFEDFSFPMGNYFKN
jgi:hypothetical protein